jgi:hypothetical protein
MHKKFIYQSILWSFIEIVLVVSDKIITPEIILEFINNILPIKKAFFRSKRFKQSWINWKYQNQNWEVFLQVIMFFLRKSYLSHPNVSIWPINCWQNFDDSGVFSFTPSNSRSCVTNNHILQDICWWWEISNISNWRKYNLNIFVTIKRKKSI